VLADKELLAVTGNDIRNAFRIPLYAPMRFFQPLAQLLADATAGNYTLLRRDINLPRISDACSLNRTVPSGQGDETFAIACSDAEDHSSFDVPFFEDYINQLKRQSPTVGPLWSIIRFTCSGWRIRPKWRFTGPFTTPPADPSLKDGVPAAPLLFMSNRLDPVTPLANAYLMSAGHPGSAVVIQEAAGHCAVGTVWSECTNDILRDYFEYGVVPKNGTVCHSDCRPWRDGCGPSELGITTMEGRHSMSYRGRWPFRPIGF
jgi:pimeloyl-ACP methyl ester carboxylesterase